MEFYPKYSITGTNSIEADLGTSVSHASDDWTGTTAASLQDGRQSFAHYRVVKNKSSDLDRFNYSSSDKFQQMIEGASQQRAEVAADMQDGTYKCPAQDLCKRWKSEIQLGECMTDWLHAFRETERAVKGLLGTDSQAHIQRSGRSGGCSDGPVAVDRGVTELFQVLEEIDNLKFQMQLVQENLMEHDLQTVSRNRHQDVAWERFEKVKESFENMLRVFAHQVGDLEECIRQEMCSGDTLLHKDETIQCSADDRSLSMSHCRMPGWDLAAAAKLKEEARLFKQEADDIATSAIEDMRRQESHLVAEHEEAIQSAIEEKRRWESYMAIEREEAQLRLKEDMQARKQWQAEHRAWQSEMREAAESMMKERRRHQETAQAWGQWQAEQLTWRKEATGTIEELKEGVATEKQRQDFLFQNLRDRIDVYASRDDQVRLSLQNMKDAVTKNTKEAVDAKKIVEHIQSKFADELRALYATQLDVQRVQLQLKKRVTTKLSQEMDNMLLISSDVQRSCAEIEQMRATAEMHFEEKVAVDATRTQYNQLKAWQASLGKQVASDAMRIKSEHQQIRSEYNHLKAMKSQSERQQLRSQDHQLEIGARFDEPRSTQGRATGLAQPPPPPPPPPPPRPPTIHPLALQSPPESPPSPLSPLV